LNPLVAYWVKGELASGDSGSGDSGSGDSAPLFNKLVVGGYIESMSWFNIENTKNLWYSDDGGETWTGQAIPLEFGLTNYTSLTHIAYGNGVYVAGGTHAQAETATNPANMIYSTDFVNWTGIPTTNTGGFASGINGLVFANNIFVAGDFGSGIKYSSDGTNWSFATFTSGTNKGIQTLNYVNNTFIGINTDAKIITSTDGLNWTEGISLHEINGTGTGLLYNIKGISYGNGKYVVVGWNQQEVGISSDLENWTFFPDLFPDGAFSAAYGNGTWVIGGRNKYDGTGTGNVAYSKDDGVTWAYKWIPDDVNMSVYPGAQAYVSFYNDKFVLNIRDEENSIAFSTDGETWTQTSSNGSINDDVPWYLYGTLVKGLTV